MSRVAIAVGKAGRCVRLALVVGQLFGSFSWSTCSPTMQGARVKAAPSVLTRSVLACGCAPHAASGLALLPCIAGLSWRRDGSEEQPFFQPTDEATSMNAPTTHDTDNASEAQFLAPETHQRAGTEWQSYSTPERLADRAWSNFQSRNVERLLDACSGVGALAYAWDRHTGADSYYGHSRDNCSLVDAIEIDARDHPTLREKNYNVVRLHFLHHKGGVIHSHVIVNPPFAQGVHFALNAWEMLLGRRGGRDSQRGNVAQPVLGHHTENTGFYEGWKSNDRTATLRSKAVRLTLLARLRGTWRSTSTRKQHNCSKL
jgi:hypothetical protein